MTGKASFKSTIAARAFIATHGPDWDEGTSTHTRVYTCPHCRWIHLTTVPTRWEAIRNAA